MYRLIISHRHVLVDSLVENVDGTNCVVAMVEVELGEGGDVGWGALGWGGGDVGWGALGWGGGDVVGWDERARMRIRTPYTHPPPTHLS